jgi:hypothetical protein
MASMAAGAGRRLAMRKQAFDCQAADRKNPNKKRMGTRNFNGMMNSALRMNPIRFGCGGQKLNPRFWAFLHSLYARARLNGNLELSRSGNGVRNGFRRLDGRGSGQFAESALDTLYVRATGLMVRGSPAATGYRPTRQTRGLYKGRIDIVAF